MNRRINLEICTGDPEGVEAAVAGGADRIELCSGLAEGGLTPSLAMIKYSASRIPTNVLIRPRSGDFVYSPAELDVMEEDIESAIGCGASGIVIGILTPDGKIDEDACRRLLKKAQGLDNTFHRAFDVAADPFEALETIINLGFKRILTSGTYRTALEGAAIIEKLRKQAAGRIKIMAGAGVNPGNAEDIIRLSGADEIHASARSILPSAMEYSGKASMGSADAADGSRLATDRLTVAAIRKALDDINYENFNLY